MEIKRIVNVDRDNKIGPMMYVVTIDSERIADVDACVNELDEIIDKTKNMPKLHQQLVNFAIKYNAPSIAIREPDEKLLEDVK